MDFTSNTYLLAQAFALISMIVSIVSQQYKSRQVILILFIVANLANAVHFFILAATTGVVKATVGAVRFLVAIFSTNRYWLFLFLIINTVTTWYVFEGALLSGTSYFAATFIILSSFLKSDHWMRVAIALGGLGWLFYGILIGSVVAIIANAFFFGSSLLGWYRHVYCFRHGKMI